MAASAYNFGKKMKKEQILNIGFKNAVSNLKARIVLISFQESDNYIVYSPHLEVSGYGKTPEEAKESFEVNLRMFLDYTTNKKTLHKELLSLGWVLKKGTPKHIKKINAPDLSVLLSRNNQLQKILNRQDVVTRHRDVLIPA